MAFSRPTFETILARVQADINGRLPGADSRLRRSVLNVISYMLAGLAHGLYGFISWISLQVFPDTAELEFLERWGSIWKVPKKSATKATGSITATGIDDSVIPSESQLQRSDGVLFITKEEATIVSGTASVTIEASEFGSKGNTTAASVLNFVSPPSGINASATVSMSAITGGADIETDTAYRPRVLARIQEPPHGGAAHDYVGWALQVAGVTRAWVYPRQDGSGIERASHVTVRFMMDDTYSDGIPQSSDLDTVKAYIEERRPATAKIHVPAPVAQPLNFNITLTSNDTAETRAAVEAELRDMLLRDAEPGGTIYLSRINAAISSASGQFDHILISPVANVTHAIGYIATFGAITWTPV